MARYYLGTVTLMLKKAKILGGPSGFGKISDIGVYAVDQAADVIHV